MRYSQFSEKLAVKMEQLQSVFPAHAPPAALRSGTPIETPTSAITPAAASVLVGSETRGLLGIPK